MTNKIILHIPHSSTVGITDKGSGWRATPSFIDGPVRKLTDWYTDVLFTQAAGYDSAIVFPYSRFCVDVERLENDPLEKIGQGRLYTRFNRHERNMDKTNVDRWLDACNEHYKLLEGEIEENAILIDCHSFSPASDTDVDICIGHNDDWSFDPLLVQIAVKTFKDSGYSVAVNAPYSNSLTPTSTHKYKSLMLEVNKKVYMNEPTLTLNPNPRQWMRWSACLTRLYTRLKEAEVMFF